MDWSFAIQCFAAFVAILNPIGAIPLYLGLTSQRDELTSLRIARRATGTVLVTLVASAVIGHAILSFFGITLPAFRVGGGILVLLMAISMLQGRMSYAKQAPEEAGDMADRESIAIVPLGIPILAGPGSISTAILLAQRAGSWPRTIILAGAILLVTSIVYVTFRISHRVERYLGRTEIGIANRVMGLILAAVAIEFIAGGLKEMFPILAQIKV